MMKTYAEILKEKEENNMTNYDQDEIERLRDKEKRSRGIKDTQSVEIGKSKEATTPVEIELPSDDLLILALAAHDRDITLNQLVNNVLRDSLKTLEYKFEHGNKPILLTENKWYNLKLYGGRIC